MRQTGLLGFHFDIIKVIFLLDLHYPLLNQFKHGEKAYYNINPFVFPDSRKFFKAELDTRFNPIR